MRGEFSVSVENENVYVGSEGFYNPTLKVKESENTPWH